MRDEKFSLFFFFAFAFGREVGGEGRQPGRFLLTPEKLTANTRSFVQII